MPSDYQIGSSVETLTPVDELTVPLEIPFGDYQMYSSQAQLASHKMRRFGPPIITWTMSMSDVEQIEQLDEFNLDAPVYIRSRKKNDTFGIFQVLFNWSDEREDGVRKPLFLGTRFEAVIQFTVLGEVTP